MSELVSICGEFAGGMVAAGTECIVVLRRSEEEVQKINVVSGTPESGPKEFIEKISELSEIPTVELEIFVYAVSYTHLTLPTILLV